MNHSTLVIGGCRSGKSSQALHLADAQKPDRKLFVATCVPQDPEMLDRVARHKKERDSHWLTIETPLTLAETIDGYGSETDLILIDCLTLWVSNLMMENDEDEIHNAIDQLCDRLQRPPCPVILVSNEVGTGIVPENHIARRYRDLVGRANQRVAAACHSVIWMVAGIPVTIKPTDAVGKT